MSNEKRKQFGFRFFPSMVDQLKIRAAKENRSLNNYVERLLKSHIDGKK